MVNRASRSRTSQAPRPAPRRHPSIRVSPARPALRSASRRRWRRVAAAPLAPPVRRDGQDYHAPRPAPPRLATPPDRRRIRQLSGQGSAGSCEQVLHLAAVLFKMLAHFLECRRLELAHALLRKAQLLAKAFQSARRIAQLALAHDEAFAFVQLAHRIAQPIAQRLQVMILLDKLIAARGFILYRVNPLAPFVLHDCVAFREKSDPDRRP